MNTPTKSAPPAECISCKRPAKFVIEAGKYCKNCMEIHLLEKMFVQVTKVMR